jgi:uracil-DNA glycosylase family 4
LRLIQSGPRDAKVVLVGEAPGANEEAAGRPFIGGSGELLDRMLAGVGISRSECFVTNICHMRPPDNEFNWFYKKANQLPLMQGIVQLKMDIDAIKPNLVVAFGAQPLRILTSKPSIEKWRGSILESALVKGQKVIATYHPAYALRVWDYKAVIELDLARCAREAQFPEIVRPRREYYLNPDTATRLKLAEEMYHAPWLAVDIECVEEAPGVWKLSCVGFSDRRDRVMVIPVVSSDDRLFVASLCSCPAQKIFQNGSFDTTILGQNGITVTGYGEPSERGYDYPLGWDTMLGHHSIYTECAGEDEVSVLTRKGGKKKSAAIMKGLAFQTSVYTDEPYYKDDGKLWKETGDLNTFWLYNGRDSAVTREIKDVQVQEIAEFGVEQVMRHEMSLVRPLMSMTNRGILIDKVTHAKLKAKYEGEIANLQRFLEATVGSASNAKSPKQMQGLLYDQLKLPVQRKRKTGKPTSDKDAINALAAKHPHPVLLSILEIRERRDLVERYLNTAYDADGRMRCSFDITGTRGGRLSSRASIFGSGTNLQNQPEEIREMFIPDPGYAFVYRDYSQAEARVVAYIAGAEGLIALFEDPSRDVHKENASRIFGIPVEVVSEEQRYNAKRGVHAFNYGMEDDQFVRVVNQAYRDTGFRMNHQTARRIREGYFLLYPEIKANFWRGVERELRQSRTLVNAFGRKRIFFGRWDDKLLRDAYSYKPQATVGDLCCKALVRCYYDIELGRPELNAQLLLNVHDSLLMQCPIEHAEEVARLMEDAMHIPVTIEGSTFYIPTDCKVGFNWANRPKKDPSTNPRGLVALDKFPNWRELLAA